MSGLRATPDQKKEVIILRSAGWTLSAIAQKTDLSIRTVQRIITQHKVVSGSYEDELIQTARNEMLAAFSNDETIKGLYSELIQDSISQINHSRIKAYEAIEQLDPKDTKSGALTMRALSAHATAIKLHCDTFRSLLPRPIDQETLPQLIVRAMTTEEVERLRREQDEESKLLNCEVEQEDEILHLD